MTATAIRKNGMNGVNGSAINGSPDEGLKVLIVGAGIAGLTAGIGLRKQGHHVQVSKRG